MSESMENSGDLASVPCNVCLEQALVEFPVYRTFHRVTSDCRPWPAGGRMLMCSRCGCVQKVADAKFRSECDEIYNSYTPYYQAKGGAEQAVFDTTSGESSPRSRRVLERLAKEFGLAATGRMLDVGSGNGAMIRAFSQMAAGWSLAGSDLTDRYRDSIQAIPRVERLYTCPLEEIPGTFNLITMSHVLEHVIEPRGFLALLKAKLAPGGLLLAQLPSYQHNPFELMVADHASHFSADTARDLLQRAGYEVPASVEGWVPKELSVVARVATSPNADRPTSLARNVEEVKSFVASRLKWLAQAVETARAGGGRIGLFGTSIAATWLLAELGETVAFFVDEDVNRTEANWNGRPVYRPADVPAGSRVFVGLAPVLAESVCRRLAGHGVTYVPPVPLPA